MNFCTRSLKNLDAVKQEVDKIIYEDHGDETINQVIDLEEIFEVYGRLEVLPPNEGLRGLDNSPF